MIASRISHYEILEKLGEGGMGVVYKARDVNLERPVAIKVLAAEAVANPDRKRRFVQEARAASALNHPNIITIHEIAQADGIDFMVMEFVRGRTLAQMTRGKRLRAAETLKNAVQIAGALAKAHGEGIVHRDLKPTNVMVTDDGLVKVLDFGLAKLMEPAERGETDATATDDAPHTEHGTVLGTAPYMSPEQAEGKRIDARTDIFAFGAVLYEMVAGVRAFRGESRIATLSEILHREPKPLRELAPEVSPELERVIARCLRKDLERRFQNMSDLRVALQELQEESASGAMPAGAAARPATRRRLWAGAAAGIVVAAVATALWFWGPWRAGEPMSKATPLTTYPGSEWFPSLSPDGSQVAFCWNGEKQDNYDIYVKLIGAGTQLRLTSTPAFEFGGAWSPDGRWIAFMRWSPESLAKAGVFLISPLGGRERKVGECVWPAMAWSPGSKWLAVTDADSLAGPSRLFLISMETGAKRPLTTPPERWMMDFEPAFSPDGRRLVFARRMSAGGDLYAVSLAADGAPQGEPVRLTSDASSSAPVFTPDGREIVFASSREGSPALWRMEVSGSSAGKPQRVAVAGEAWFPVISRQAPHRLAYSRGDFDYNIWRAETAGGKPPVVFISSTRIEGGARFSPDGRRIAFVSDRSGKKGIWLCDADGSNTVQLTAFDGPPLGSLHWSPDGQQIAAEARPRGHGDIYLVGAGGGPPRPLVADPSDDVQPTWSRDGKWVYFGSDRGGRTQIWKVPAGGGAAVQVTRNGGFAAVESPDGKYLYYTKNRQVSGLWKAPVEGGEESLVLDAVNAMAFEVTGDGIWFLPPSNFFSREGVPLRFLSIAGGTAKTIAATVKPALGGLSVSPDRRWVLYTQVDRSEFDLMLVENFR